MFWKRSILDSSMKEYDKNKMILNISAEINPIKNNMKKALA